MTLISTVVLVVLLIVFVAVLIPSVIVEDKVFSLILIVCIVCVLVVVLKVNVAIQKPPVTLACVTVVTVPPVLSLTKSNDHCSLGIDVIVPVIVA